MNDLFKKDNINGIWISIVAGILLSQIFDPLIKIGKNLGKGVINAFVDYFFYSCSNTNDTYFVNYILYIVFLLIILPIIKDAFSIIIDLRKKGNVSKSLPAKTPEKEAENPLSEIVDNVIKMKALDDKREKRRRFTQISSAICAIVLILSLLDVALYKYAPTIVKGTFDRCIVQITPYVEKERIDLLKSNWVSMKTKSDYDIIANEIDSILIENELK